MAETLRKPDSGGSSTISLEAPTATEHDTSSTTTYHIDLDVSDGQSSDASSPGHFSCLFDPVKKTNGLLMLLFGSDGNSTLKEMSRQHVLRMTQEAARSVSSMCPGSKLPAETASVCDLQPVHARDIRRMENAFSSSNEPSVAIRQQAIFFSADPLRAIILRDACLVYVPDGADSLLSMLKHYFVMNARDDTSPYEFRALEALLATLAKYFRAQYDQLSPIIIVDLECLVHRHLDARELERLREFKNTMNEFESQVDGVRRVLMELLDNEEDLRLLYLTKLFETPSLPAKPRRFWRSSTASTRRRPKC